MELENPSNGESEPELGNPRTPKSPWLADEIDSSCSTPYASAPSSPGRAPPPCSYFFSAPASPMHFVLSTPPFTSSAAAAPADLAAAGSFEFDFSATRPSSPDAGAMSSADELFHNGKIRPMKLSSHLQRPQKLAPLIDLEDEDEGTAAPARGREMKMRSRSMHRRARSMSPMRNSRWSEDEEGKPERKDLDLDLDLDLDSDPKQAEDPSAAIQPESASSSRSSSSGRNSKKWIFLKDLLYRSKSEGSAKGKEKFWHSISFSPSSSKEKQKPSASAAAVNSSARKSGARPTNGVGKPRKSPAPSAHELHYTAKRAQAEEMRKRTFLPYRQGLLGCLGFSSRSYGAMNGFARALNPVPSK